MTCGSDVDLFFLAFGETEQSSREIKDAYRASLTENGVKMPAQDGVFEDILGVDDLLSNIGGDDDTNKFLTRRMLYVAYLVHEKGGRRRHHDSFLTPGAFSSIARMTSGAPSRSCTSAAWTCVVFRVASA